MVSIHSSSSLGCLGEAFLALPAVLAAAFLVAAFAFDFGFFSLDPGLSEEPGFDGATALSRRGSNQGLG